MIRIRSWILDLDWLPAKDLETADSVAEGPQCRVTKEARNGVECGMEP